MNYISVGTIVLFVLILSITIQLASRRKDKYQRITRSIFYRTQRPGGGAWGMGQWQYGYWDVGQQVNDAITAGKQRYSHQRRIARRRHSKPHKS